MKRLSVIGVLVLAMSGEARADAPQSPDATESMIDSTSKRINIVKKLGPQLASLGQGWPKPPVRGAGASRTVPGRKAFHVELGLGARAGGLYGVASNGFLMAGAIAPQLRFRYDFGGSAFGVGLGVSYDLLTVTADVGQLRLVEPTLATSVMAVPVTAVVELTVDLGRLFNVSSDTTISTAITSLDIGGGVSNFRILNRTPAPDVDSYYVDSGFVVFVGGSLTLLGINL